MFRKPTILELALEEANRLQNDSRWVEVDLRTPNIIHLSWGTIRSNGDWERAIASRRYEQRDSAVEIGPVMAHS